MDALEEVVWMHPKLHLVEYKKSSNQRTKIHILYFGWVPTLGDSLKIRVLVPFQWMLPQAYLETLLW